MSIRIAGREYVEVNNVNRVTRTVTGTRLERKIAKVKGKANVKAAKRLRRLARVIAVPKAA